MSKYQITHSCGCVITHNIGGTNVRGERDRKAAWLAEQPCFECRCTAENEAAAAQNAHLPSLQGSAKQIAWAESIRAKVQKQLDNVVSRFRQDVIATDPEKRKIYEEALVIINSVRNQTSASWWIDNRDTRFDLNWLGRAMRQNK